MDMDQRYIFDLKASGIQLTAAFRTILAQYVGDDANTEILVNRLYTKTVRDIFSNMAGDIEIVHGKYSSLPDPTGIEDIMAMLHPDSKEQVRVCSELAAIEIYLTVHNYVSQLPIEYTAVYYVPLSVGIDYATVLVTFTGVYTH